MHELSLAIDILKTALEQGEANQALRINDIHLEAVSPSALTHINSENIQSYFDLVSKGTIAEGAEISIEFATDNREAATAKFSSTMNDLEDELGELDLTDMNSLLLKSMRIEKQ